MSAIRLLDKDTIDKIAAGEVVDRPASIVKELIENSIDAGADAISVEIRDGGTSLIRITDNGSGIAADQIALAFLRHSTSKIQTASDLSFIHTLGFRGEALSSIAAVSRTELCTKTADSLTGIIYKINGGQEISCAEAGLPDGTTIIVRDLFYNTPARLKFLKSAQTEAGYIQDVVQRVALSRPDISFKYTSNGSVRLSTAGNGSLKDAVYAVFGRDITSHLLDLKDENDIVSIDGFIGKPEIARGNRNFEYFFINGRYIRDRIIQKALEDAYEGYQMKGTFPFAILNLSMEPELIDVNVHPSKMEVRFFDNEAVYHAIYDLIRKRIVRRENIPQISLESGQEIRKDRTPSASAGKAYVPEPFETVSRKQYTGVQESAAAYGIKPEETVQSREEAVSSESAQAAPMQEYEQSSLFEQNFLTEQSRPKHRIIGQIFDTYWLVEFDEKLFIIDQHAAHEKVLYEKFMKRLKEGTHYSQQLMPPVIVTLSSQEAAALQQWNRELTEAGFAAESFGGNEYALTSVPVDFYTTEYQLLFVEMLDDLAGISARSGQEIVTDRIATAACKAAVKGGNKLSFAEMNTLLDELLSLDNPYNCPHGRPTIISMSKYELEKKFKRIV